MHVKKILIVDDDDDVLETIKLILEIGGYEVDALNDATLVFDNIEDFEPDLILLDIVLGKIDGRTICKQIKSHQDTQHIPVLLMSGLYNNAEVTNMERPPDDFMLKPFKMEVLLQKIEKLLDKESLKTG